MSALGSALASAALAVLLAAALACGGESASAPDFELTLFANEDHRAGETLRLSRLADRPVVLNFWFPSCPPCVAEMPHFEEAYQKFKPEGVAFIGVQLLGLDSSNHLLDMILLALAPFVVAGIEHKISLIASNMTRAVSYITRYPPPPTTTVSDQNL